MEELKVATLSLPDWVHYRKIQTAAISYFILLLQSSVNVYKKHLDRSCESKVKCSAEPRKLILLNELHGKFPLTHTGHCRPLFLISMMKI